MPPFQGCACVSFPRALPWAFLFGPYGGKAQIFRISDFEFRISLFQLSPLSVSQSPHASWLP